jgi:hypothetical protein
VLFGAGRCWFIPTLGRRFCIGSTLCTCLAQIVEHRPYILPSCKSSLRCLALWNVGALFKFCPVPNSRLLNLSRVFALGETDCCGSEPVLALDAEWGSIAFASSAGEIGNLYKPIMRIDDLVLANSSSDEADNSNKSLDLFEVSSENSFPARAGRMLSSSAPLPRGAGRHRTRSQNNWVTVRRLPRE